MVTDGGASYAAKKDVPANTALTNTEYWQKLVNTVAGVEIGDTATYATTELLFNPEGTNEHTVPEVNDASVSEGDTWSSSKINGELSDLKSAVDKILSVDSFTLTGSTSRVYEYTFTPGNTYLVTNKKSGTTPQIRTSDSSGTLIEWIKNGLAYGETVEFKPTLPASYFRVYFASSNCEIEISTIGEALNAFNEGINTAVFDINLDVGTDATGYYSGNVGEQIAYTEQATSHSFTIDLTDYVNRVVRVKLNAGSTTSTRICALCNSSGVINQRYTESEVMRGVSFYPTTANHNLYISYSTNGSGLSCYVLSTVNASFQSVYDVTGKIAYVDSSVSAEGDGSPNNPFKQIATAINNGYGVLYVNAGNYQPVEAFNIGTVSIKLWNRTLDSNGKLKKIVITAVDRKSGIWCDNCDSVTIEDVEFNAPSRYGLYITNCKSVSVTRCIAYNNTTASFSLFRVDNSNAVFRDCVAYGATLDGFNIHTAGDTQFINCKAYNCGDDGISHHEACTGAIIGGEFYGNGKGGVSPFSGCQIGIYDVYTHDNARYGIYCASTEGADVTKIILSNCAIKNNTTADVFVSYGEIVGFNNIYDTKSVSNGTFTEVVKA